MFPWFQVPGAAPGTRFDQFPGSAAVTGGTTIAFKGNYADPVSTLGMTGVYYRNVSVNWGRSPIYKIADSTTRIPNQPAGGTVKFGSTAPPSAGGGYMFFVGLDNEDAPTMGGIYRARLYDVQQAQPAVLQTLVGIGGQVPGEAAGAGFTAFGESLSVSSDGRYVAYWAAWGSEFTSETLICPTDGNQDLIDYCDATYPSGHAVEIPVHQGIFLYDTRNNTNKVIAKTGKNGLQDFIFWVFSGQPPGTGGGDEGEGEPPRWRASAFPAVSGRYPYAIRVAYKATRSGVDGIYMYRNSWAPFVKVVELGSSGTAIDPLAPTGSVVTALGIERDGFREGYLSIAASMLEPVTSAGWAGVYVANTPMSYQ